MLQTVGFALAHALGSLRLGGTLCTLAVLQQADARSIGRYEAPSIPESIAAAHGHLTEALNEGHWAALVYDGFVTIPERGRTDALIAEVILPGGDVAGRVIQAYRRARRLGLPIIGRGPGLIGEAIIDPALDGGGAASAIEAGFREHPSGSGLLRHRE